jgi:hypothetical protein
VILDSVAIGGCVRPEAVTCGWLCQIRAKKRRSLPGGHPDGLFGALVTSVLAQRFADPALG